MCSQYRVSSFGNPKQNIWVVSFSASTAHPNSICYQYFAHNGVYTVICDICNLRSSKNAQTERSLSKLDIMIAHITSIDCLLLNLCDLQLMVISVITIHSSSFVPLSFCSPIAFLFHYYMVLPLLNNFSKIYRVVHFLVSFLWIECSVFSVHTCLVVEYVFNFYMA